MEKAESGELDYKIKDKDGNLKSFIIVRLCLQLLNIQQIELIANTKTKANHLRRGKTQFLVEDINSVICYLNSGLTEVHKCWDISSRTIFEKKYKTLDTAKAKITGGKPRIVINVPQAPVTLGLNPFAHHHENALKDMDRFLDLDPNQLLLISGNSETSKLALLAQHISRLNDKSDFRYSIVNIDSAKCNTVGAMLESLYLQLFAKCKDNMTPEARKLCESQYQSKDLIYDALSTLFRQREDWVMYLDSGCSSTDERDHIFYSLIRDTDLSALIQRILSLNTVIGKNVKIIATTDDVNRQSESTTILELEPKVNLDVLKGTVFEDMVKIEDFQYLKTDAAYQMLLLDKTLSLPCIQFDDTKNKLIAKESLEAMYYNTFNQWFYNFLKETLPVVAFKALCITALPEDNLYELSLVEILRMFHRFEFAEQNKDGDPISDKEILKKLEVDYVDQHINALKQMRKVLVTQEYSDGEEGTGERFLVHPYIRKLILSSWGIKGTIEYRERKRTHYFIGVLAFRYYEKSRVKEAKDENESKENQIPIEQEHKTVISSLSERERRLVQATHHLIISIYTHQTTIQNRKFTTESAAEALLLDVNCNIMSPEDTLNITWHLLNRVMKELNQYHNMSACELKFNLLMEFVHCGKDIQSAMSYQDVLSAPSRLIINSIQQNCLDLYKHILITAMQVNNYTMAVCACEQINFGLESGFLAGVNPNKLMVVRNKMNDAYYYIASRTGNFSEAIYFNQIIVEGNKKKLDRYLGEYQGRNANRSSYFYVRAYLESKAKELMVHMSMMNIPSIMECIKAIGQYSVPVPIAIKLSDIKQSIKTRNPDLEPQGCRLIFEMELRAKLNKVNEYSEQKIESCVQNALIADNSTTINFGQIDAGVVLFAVTEAIRALMRLKTLCDQDMLPPLIISEVQGIYDQYFDFFKQLFKQECRLLPVKDRQNKTFEAFYKNMTDSALKRLDVLNGKTDPKRAIRHLSHIRAKIVSFAWNRRLSVAWDNEMSLEAVKIQLFIWPYKTPHDRDKKLMYSQLNRAISQARKEQNPKTLSTALILKWVYFLLTKGDEFTCQQNTIEYEYIGSLQRELEQIANKFKYEYRKPEIALLKKNINPLSIFPL